MTADTQTDRTEATALDGVDLRDTIFLPKSPLPMRAGLPKLEPRIIDWWREIDLFGRLRQASKGRPPFILHDGPPYANGHLHIGHALNKILKDVVNRSQQMLGRDANYVPGWDCHGLPIEWKIEEACRKAGRDKDDVPILELRRECREFAQRWVEIQSAEFQRLGVLGDWQNPYTTMTNAAEAAIAREIHKFATSGLLYRGLKSVLWSVVEKTALAEAEVVYRDVTSDTIFVAFPVAEATLPALRGAAMVIWTTTPWTIPSNRAIAFGAEIDYRLVEVRRTTEEAGARPGDRLVYAADLAATVEAEAGLEEVAVLAQLKGAELAGTVCRHPLADGGYDGFEVPLLAGDFVTVEAGSGLVHVAPSHGADDFELGLQHGLELTENVTEDGRFADHLPLLGGLPIYRPDGSTGPANRAVIAALAEAGGLLARNRLTHSYPHSWRSKAPLIFRATAQWFIAMDDGPGAPTDRPSLRATALEALGETAFYPEAGRTRLTGMIADRPDWCVSRQRCWGVPIAIFVEKATGRVLRDEAVFGRIAAAFEQHGSDVWFSADAREFLGDAYRPEDYEQVFDIVDVWFESGSSHAFVLEPRADLDSPADLYLEGSDQHRGWFHSSLLESCGTRGRAPYRGVLTHGFVLDGQGYKMSKSAGNNVAPEDITGRFGADILRLWVVGSDYSEDLRIGGEIMKHTSDAYRRLRNTLRYLLGALSDFDPSELRRDSAGFPQLERLMLHRMWQLDGQIRSAMEGYDFHGACQALHNFCAVDLSAFYFDVRKDCLYCDRPDSPKRRALRTVLHHLFEALVRWLAPFICFTAEEAWTLRHGKDRGSVHEQLFAEPPLDWRDDDLAARWQEIRRVRRVVTGAIELERAEKRLGSSLAAHPILYVEGDRRRLLEGLDLAEIAITSDLTLAEGPPPSAAFRLDDVAGVAVVIAPAEGRKCARSWKVSPDVGSVPGYPDLSPRDADAVADWLRRRRPAA